MKLKVLVTGILLISTLGWGMPKLDDCAALLAMMSEQFSSNTETYIRIFRTLIEDKNALNADDIRIVLSQTHPVNPFKIVTPSLSTEQAYAFQQAFEKLLRRNSLDWERIKKEIAQIAQESEQKETHRKNSEKDTANAFLPIVVDKFSYQDAKDSLQMSVRLADGSPIAILRIKENLMFYDVEKRRISFEQKDDFKEISFDSYRTSSGSTVLAIMDLSDKEKVYFEIYEITPSHEIKLIKSNQLFGLDVRRWFLTKSSGENPLLVGNITGIHNGFVVIDIKADTRTEIDVGRDWGYYVSSNDGIQRWKTGKTHILIEGVSNAGYQKVLNVPNEGQATLWKVHPEIYEGEYFFSVANQYANFHWTLNTMNNKFYYIEPKALNSPIILIPNGDGYERINQIRAKTIAIFDDKNPQPEIYGIPHEFFHIKSRVLNLSDKNSVLVIGGKGSDYITLFFVNERIFIDVYLKNPGESANFVDAYTAAGGRIEALLSTSAGLKTIQVYGPASEGVK